MSLIATWSSYSFSVGVDCLGDVGWRIYLITLREGLIDLQWSCPCWLAPISDLVDFSGGSGLNFGEISGQFWNFRALCVFPYLETHESATKGWIGPPKDESAIQRMNRQSKGWIGNPKVEREAVRTPWYIFPLHFGNSSGNPKRI
jgi:hypothetical protein